MPVSGESCVNLHEEIRADCRCVAAVFSSGGGMASAFQGWSCCLLIATIYLLDRLSGQPQCLPNSQQSLSLR